MSDKFNVIGRSTPYIDGLEKAMGKTVFVSDLVRPGMLHGAVKRSEEAHARILTVDTSAAEALPGVRAVITIADTPGLRFGPRTEDWEILARDKALFHGHEIAAVAALDEDIAAEAVDLIRVEYELLPHVIDPQEALREGAPLVHEETGTNLAAEFKIESGDVDRALDAAHYVYEDRYFTNQVYQAYLEPKGAIAEWDLSGRLTLMAGTQIPNMMRMTYAQALGLSPDAIRVKVPDYGGGFGAKMEHTSHLIAALLAKKAGAPVRLFHSREEDFRAGNPRVPMYYDIKLGLDRDGRLLAKDVQVIGGAGARLVYAHIITATACYRVDSLYNFKNVRAKGLTAYTNSVPTSCFRGFGNSQGTFALESALDMAAHGMGIDPAELRKINDLGPNSTSIHDWKINSNGLVECIDEATKASGWAAKRAEVSPRQGRYRGVGLACCNHVSGNRPFAREFDGGSGVVRIGRDGRVTVFHGESDMGQGQKTVFAMIAAERLGVSLDRVHVEDVDTDISPFGFGSFATRGTVMGGNGVLLAAENASLQLAEFAAEMLEANPADLVCKADQWFVEGSPEKSVSWLEVTEAMTLKKRGAPVIGTGFYEPPTVLPDLETKKGNISPAYPFACQIAEVEVDAQTGQVKVVGFWAAHDVGRALNPMALEGQIQGGVAMGLGWTLTENMAYDENGKLINADFLDYVLPGPGDIPKIEPILVEPIEKEGPYGAKGIGEPALNPTMAAITNAIYNAVGVRVKALPVNPEELLKAIKKI